MKTQKINVALATGAVVLALVLASTANAAVVMQLNFNHGEQPATAEPTYTPVAGEFLNGATFTLTGTAGVFTNSPAPVPDVTGQSWYNSDQANWQGYNSVNHPLVHDSFTLEARVYLNSTNGIQGIYQSNGTTGSGKSSFTISGNQPYFSIYTAGVDDLYSSVTLKTGQWYHLAFVYDNPEREKRIYVDGELAATVGFFPGLELPGYLSITSDVYLAHSSSINRNLNGYMDGLVISDQVLNLNSFVLFHTPEPGTLALGVMGAMIIWSGRRRLARQP